VADRVGIGEELASSLPVGDGVTVPDAEGVMEELGMEHALRASATARTTKTALRRPRSRMFMSRYLRLRVSDADD
jgi:hypothetical protein